MPRLPQNHLMLAQVARRFRVLGEPMRLRILQLLERGERSVGEICVALRAGQPNVSKHLAALADAGLVRRRRNGNSIYCSIADPVVFRLCELVCRSAEKTLRRQYQDALPRRRAS